MIIFRPQWLFYLFLAGAIVMTQGCDDREMAHYADTTPVMDMRAYFSGPIKAWGLIQDWRGRVTVRFDVDMVGRWDGDTGRLEESFRYYDGQTQKRVWTIRQIAPGRYEGTADDIIGTAQGTAQGTAGRWRYRMDVPVGDTTYRLSFDDWVWQMNDGVVINRSYLKKFGITVAQLTLFMQKQDGGQDGAQDGAQDGT